MIPTLAQPAPRGGLALPPRYLSFDFCPLRIPQTMPFSALNTLLAVLAVALPFLFAVTAPPSPNFWPLVFSWACGLALAAWGLVQGANVVTRAQCVRLGNRAAGALAWGLLLAAVLGGVVGLLQYLGAEPWGLPWIHPSTPGEAVGNLRQRNQQASLMALGVWSLLWLWVRAERVQRPQWGMGMVLGGALAVLAVAAAATNSRTGALQWLLMLGLLCLWRRTDARKAIALVLVGMVLYVLAAWALPQVLLQVSGIRIDGLFDRFSNTSGACGARRVLWSNMLHLISLKPWTGWGWGELSYAHYITLFPEERFCVLLDNAHNLPLHLAVELGLPAALLLCGGVLAWLVWSRPWRETDPVRQLAWGVVAVVGLHSLLEYPLWYGPFQVTTLFALVLLCWRRAPGRGVPEAWRWLGSKLGDVTVGWGLGAAVCLIGAAVLGMAAYQYRVVSQLYKPVAQRPPALRDVRAVPQPKGVLFSDQVRFAWLTTQDLTPANAAQMHAVALDLLHFSPEPRVIEKVVDGALALGRADEAALHQQRYRIAYPNDFARWQARRANAASASGAQ